MIARMHFVQTYTQQTLVYKHFRFNFQWHFTVSIFTFNVLMTMDDGEKLRMMMIGMMIMMKKIN